jgi:cold-inducible RNA-binding protein
MAVRLYIGNLPFSITDQDLKDLFAQSGNVVSASVISDRDTGRSRGFAFVEMDTQEEADAAIAKFNGYDFSGRQLTVNIARPKEERAGGGGGGRGGFGGNRGGFGGGRGGSSYGSGGGRRSDDNNRGGGGSDW